MILTTTTEIKTNGEKPLQIKAADPRASYFAHKEEIDRAISGVLTGGQYVLGEQVAQFEGSFAEYVDPGSQCIGVGCGTDALILAMRALGVCDVHEVIVGAYVPLPVVAAICEVGAIPVIVDVKADDLTIDPEQVEKNLSPRTRAIIAVHIFGNPCDMESLVYLESTAPARYVIEDVSQAHGGTYEGHRLGSFGKASCFSFYPTKPLGAFGDGGAVVTRDQYVAESVRAMRQYGWEDDLRLAVRERSGCSRLDEIQAAILNVKLKHLDDSNAACKWIGNNYRSVFPSFNSLESIYHQAVLRHPQRDRLRIYLRNNGIGTTIHYPLMPWENPSYASLCDVRSCRVAIQAQKQVLSLPLWSEMRTEQIDYVCGKVRSYDSR